MLVMWGEGSLEKTLTPSRCGACGAQLISMEALELCLELHPGPLC